MKRLEGWAAVLLGLGGASWGAAVVLGLDPSAATAGSGALVTAFFATAALLYAAIGAGGVIQALRSPVRRRRYLASLER